MVDELNACLSRKLALGLGPKVLYSCTSTYQAVEVEVPRYVLPFNAL